MNKRAMQAAVSVIALSVGLAAAWAPDAVADRLNKPSGDNWQVRVFGGGVF